MFYKLILAFVLVQLSLFSEVEKVVILGSGPAGLTAGIFAGQANLAPLIIEGEPDSGQLEVVGLIENFPGFPEGISGNELMSRIREQALRFGARSVPAHLEKVDLAVRPFRLDLSDGQTVYTESLIVALGTKKRWLGLASEEALKAKGVFASAYRDGDLFVNKRVVVAGGGDAALEEALILAEKASHVVLIHRGSSFNAAPYLQERVKNHEKIELIFDAVIEEILDVEKGFVTAVALKDQKSGIRSSVACEGVFVSVGRQMNTTYFKGQLEMNPQGQLMIKQNGTQTSIPGVFAAGDVTELPYRKAVAAAAYGCMAAIDAIQFLKAL